MAKIDLIILHCTDGSESFQSAENGAAYAARGNPDATGKLRPASFHFIVDPNSIVQCVPEASTAYGAAKANARGIHVEFCGLAKQTAAQWADVGSDAEVRLGAKLFADICRRRNITKRFLTGADLKAGAANGITTHAEISKAWPSTGHTDPGPNFPLKKFMDLVKQLP